MTGFFGIAFAFVMAACGGNSTAEDSTAVDSAAMAQTEQCEHQCMQHCQATCPDSVCLANNCENCTCPDSAACKQTKCEGNGKCEGKGEGCQGKAEGACCKGDQAK